MELLLGCHLVRRCCYWFILFLWSFHELGIAEAAALVLVKSAGLAFAERGVLAPCHMNSFQLDIPQPIILHHSDRILMQQTMDGSVVLQLQQTFINKAILHLRPLLINCIIAPLLRLHAAVCTVWRHLSILKTIPLRLANIWLILVHYLTKVRTKAQFRFI